MCNVVGYVRVSTEEQVKNGQGLDIQEKEINDFCKARKYNLVKIFSDEGISGAKEDRKGMNDLLEYVKENKINKVIVLKLDRLSRDAMYGLFIRKELKKMDAELVSIKEENLTGTDPVQNLMNTIVFAFAEFEKEQITYRMLSGRRSKAKEKKQKASGNCPIGYKYKYNDQGKTPVVVVDQGRAETVKEIYSLYLRGKSVQKIADILNEKGITTERGNKFSKQSIHLILTNDFYTGVVRFNDIIQPGAHESIISKVTFGKVQAALKKKRNIKD
jgi:DNA invertase Pin-like site-specific DNA recombinase